MRTGLRSLRGQKRHERCVLHGKAAGGVGGSTPPVALVPVRAAAFPQTRVCQEALRALPVPRDGSGFVKPRTS